MGNLLCCVQREHDTTEPAKIRPQSKRPVTNIDQIKQIDQLLQKSKFDAPVEEQRELTKILQKMPDKNQQQNIDAVMSKMFEVAESKMNGDEDKAILRALKTYLAQAEFELLDSNKPRYIDTLFFPNEQNVTRLIRYLDSAKKTLNICIFTLTNDKIANAVKDAHQRGVKVRVITDDECMNQQGSDITWLAEQGIEVRTDNAKDFHMHNKFVVVDDTFLITGSFNWTVAAGMNNQENLLVVDHPYYITEYNNEFEKLWSQFAKNVVQGE